MSDMLTPNYRILFEPFKVTTDESLLPIGLEFFPVGTIVNDFNGHFEDASLPCDGRGCDPEQYPQLTQVLEYVNNLYGTDENGWARVPDLHGRVDDE